MRKSEALNLVLNFERARERELIAEQKLHEAYQIENARNHMLYALMDGVKALKERLPLMFEYTTNDDIMPGFKYYDPFHFVAHDETRKAVEAFYMEHFK